MTTFNISIIIVLLLTGGIVRFVEGSKDETIPHLILQIALFLVPFGEMLYFTHDPGISFSVAFWSSMCLIIGHTDWKDFEWQFTRFALFGFAAMFGFGPGGILCVVMFALAGLMYPILFWIDEHVFKIPTWKFIDGPEAYARFFAGVVVLNPVVWLIAQIYLQKFLTSL